MKKLLILSIIILPQCAAAQYDTEESNGKSKPATDFGIGFGLDYGGIGGRLTFSPDKHIGIFGSVGYALVGAGYNFGARIRFNPEKRFCFVAGGMYGYNGVIQVAGASQYDKIYYGPSIFAGGELRARNRRNYFNFELVLPFRPNDFTNDLNKLKSNPSITFKNDVLPIAISVGYHFGF